MNDDLWAEHVARYTFAARFAANRLVLDIGSGAGYGVAELSHGARTITGIDSAQDAVGYARANTTPLSRTLQFRPGRPPLRFPFSGA